MFLIITIISIVMLLALYCHRKLTFWQRQGVPTPGLMYQWHFYTRELAALDQELHKQLGPVYGIYEGLSPVLIIGDPELVREVLIKEFAKFPNHKPFKLGDASLDTNMFAMDGNEDWKRIRSIISPSFTSGKLRGMNSHVKDCVAKLIQNFEETTKIGKPFDAIPKFRSLSFDVLLRCAYGVQIDTYTTSDSPVAKNLYAIFASRYSSLFNFLFPNASKLLGVKDIALKPFRFFIELTDKLIKERKAMKSPPQTDLLQLMLDASKEGESSGKTISDLEIKAQSLSFLIAGFHATSVTMSFALYHLAANPEVQEKLYKEVQRFDTLDSPESISELKYLEAVLKESLRLNSPVVRVDRECVQKHKLGNVTVLPGTIVSIPTFPIHLDPKSYYEPEKFKPERFMEGGSDVNHSPSAFIPFGGGPRICVAQRFALMEIKCSLVHLVQTFQFETTPQTKLTYNRGVFDSLLDPKEICLRVTKR